MNFVKCFHCLHWVEFFVVSTTCVHLPYGNCHKKIPNASTLHYRYVGLKEHKYRDFKSISHSEEFWIIFVASNIVVSLMSSLQPFDTPKFLLFLNKKIERILRTSDLWQKLCCGIGKSFESIRKCVVPEKAHTPPTEGMGNSWGWRGGGLKGQNF